MHTYSTRLYGTNKQLLLVRAYVSQSAILGDDELRLMKSRRPEHYIARHSF